VVWPRGDQDRDRARAIFNKVHFSFFWLEKHFKTKNLEKVGAWRL